MNFIVRLFWPLFLITLLYYCYIWVFILPEIKTNAGGLTPLDAAITGYNFDDVQQFFAALQASGDTAFKSFHDIDDMIFPALYGFTMAIAIWALNFGWSKTVRIILSGVPLSAAIVDYFENGEFIKMIDINPAQITVKMAEAANTLTTTKYGLIALSLAIIAVILVRNFVANSPRRKMNVSNG